MKNNQPIGVFDSGVGGLSILLELQKLLPNENFVFLADQAYLPYGEKSSIQLINRCTDITDYFIKKHHIKIMIIACNTATASTINALRKKYSLPIVGTIPALKPAAQHTASGTIAVLSTPSTSKSLALKKLIKDNCKGVNVLNIGCKGLASVVEGDIGITDGKQLLEKYLQKVKNSKADYLVLGCTQYPFLRKTIQKIVGSRVQLLDSGKAIAKYAKSLLISKNMTNKEKIHRETLYFTTGNTVKFSRVATKLLKHKIQTKKIRI